TADYPLDRAALLRSYGRVLARLGRFDDARAAWNEALTIATTADPLEIALTYHAIGQAFRAQQDHTPAEEAFRRALEHYPQNSIEKAATFRELGQTLLEATRSHEAIAPL